MTTGGKPVRVAVLDDHTAFAEALCLALDGATDMECVGHAGSVSGCVELALETRPDVMILDYQLLEGDGLQCATLLRDAGVDCGMIMLTANASADLHRRALDVGITGGVLPKHAPLREVLESIQAVVSES